MAGPPTRTVTFLFTDIEGSTRLLQALGDRYADVLAEYRRLLRAACWQHGGQEADTPGDEYFAVFPRARDALLAAVAAQRDLVAHQWPEGVRVGVRTALHTGEPLSRDTGYVGIDVHRASRICAAAHGGQVLLSQTTRDLVAGDLPQGTSLRDLGEHRLKDLGPPERLHQIVAIDLPADFPPLRSVDILPNNLPIQLTSFIGRVHEIVEVQRLLARTRLLTLTGAGGSGKTRLALQVAADLLETYPDGVWWAELASLVNLSDVPGAVATAVGIPEQLGRPLVETLTDSLPAKNMLLVLDNCEHLVTACAALTDTLLRACPQLRVMATSREALGLAGELTYRVPSLSLPDIKRLPHAQRLLDYEAVRLFAERAAFVDPHFEVTSNNAAAVAQICARLDGIPLALELAAARVKVLAVEQIAKRLDDRFRLLTAGSRAAIPRHQTLRAALDWSYALLSDREQLLLDRLSVFAGGWTLEAAEAVCSGGGVEASDMLDLLAQLVDKSLVQTDSQPGEVRYRLLETVRQYGRERLRDREGEHGTIKRHRDFFLALAEESAKGLAGRDSVTLLDKLEDEHDNLRAALAMSLETGEVEEAARLAVALLRLWQFRGHFEEGWERLTELLSRRTQVSAPVRAALLNSAGLLASYRTSVAETLALCLEALPLYRELGDKRGTAICAYRVGYAYMVMGNHARAAECFEESMRLFGELKDHPWIGEVVRVRGMLAARQGDYARATTMLEESRALAHETGSWWVGAQAFLELGGVKRYQGEYAEATRLFQKCMAEFRDHGDRGGVASSLVGMAGALWGSGDFAHAVDHYSESLTLAHEIGVKDVTIHCLYGLAAVKATRRQPEDAARLLGAAGKLCESFNQTLPQAERIEYDGVAASVRRSLGQMAYEQAVAEGRDMTREQAIALALAPIQEATTEPTARPAAGKHKTLLTLREHEVAALIAQGLTNRQIASRLVVAEKTIDAHVQHILNKLGAHSRTQIALWAAEHGPGASPSG